MTRGDQCAKTPKRRNERDKDELANTTGIRGLVKEMGDRVDIYIMRVMNRRADHR